MGQYQPVISTITPPRVDRSYRSAQGLPQQITIAGVGFDPASTVASPFGDLSVVSRTGETTIVAQLPEIPASTLNYRSNFLATIVVRGPDGKEARGNITVG